MSKSLDIYVIERHGVETVFVIALWVVKQAVLARYRLGDARRFVTRGKR